LKGISIKVKKDFHLEIKSKGGKCKGATGEENKWPEIKGEIFGEPFSHRSPFLHAMPCLGMTRMITSYFHVDPSDQRNKWHA
jgi:hypothetical protein